MKLSEKILIPTILVLLIVIIIGYKFLSKENKKYDFSIYFFEAGKADAILISKNNKYMMIDTGEQSLSNDILEYFKDNNINKLEYLIITHFDKDHVGSASSIIDNIEIGEVLQSNYPKDSEYYNNYVESLNKKNITPKTITNDYEINIDDMKITVNGPLTTYDKNESNNSSLIVSLINDNKKYLFMGDSQNQRIDDFINENKEVYDFLKVPYHGYYQKELDNLLKEKQIKYAVITSSDKKLEDEETIELLKKYNIDYYLTRKGSILITSEDNTIIINQ